DPIFAVDLVRALQERARRLLAQHVFTAGTGQEEGGVRLPRRGLVGRDRPLKARQLGFEIFGQPRSIDLRGLMGEGGHARCFPALPRAYPGTETTPCAPRTRPSLDRGGTR